MTALRNLDTEFTNGEVRQFQGRGGQTFDYIEDETVMDRLDEVLGKGEWSIQVEAVSVADGIVKVTLSALGGTYEDFGYANNPNGDALKEAVSDGIRRCGRYLGIGRYLYKKPQTSGAGRTPSRPAPAPRPTVVRTEDADTNLSTGAEHRDDPYADLPWGSDEVQPYDGPSPFAPIGGSQPQVGEECPLHPGEKWRGNPGDLYHRKPEGGYCRPEGQPKKAKPRRQSGEGAWIANEASDAGSRR